MRIVQSVDQQINILLELEIALVIHLTDLVQPSKQIHRWVRERLGLVRHRGIVQKHIIVPVQGIKCTQHNPGFRGVEGHMLVAALDMFVRDIGFFELAKGGARVDRR